MRHRRFPTVLLLLMCAGFLLLPFSSAAEHAVLGGTVLGSSGELSGSVPAEVVHQTNQEAFETDAALLVDVLTK